MSIAHAVQPYLVGGKKKSLAIIIPARIVRELKIGPQTIFGLSWLESEERIVLDLLEPRRKSNSMTISSKEV
jgi:hypothetical protein